jgi:methylphosphotriester-DNA--protein-cysteine methyltransferase
MVAHHDITDAAIRLSIRQKGIRFGGNRKLKIYGTLSCASGKGMKRENRVFFYSEAEALKNGYRPCGNCMRVKYQRYTGEKYKPWKNGLV